MPMLTLPFLHQLSAKNDPVLTEERQGMVLSYLPANIIRSPHSLCSQEFGAAALPEHGLKACVAIETTTANSLIDQRLFVPQDGQKPPWIGTEGTCGARSSLRMYPQSLQFSQLFISDILCKPAMVFNILYSMPLTIFA